FDLSFSPPGISYVDGRWASEGPLSLALTRVQAGSGATPFFSTSRLALEADSLSSLLSECRVKSVSLGATDLLASDETLSRFLAPRAADAPAAPEPDSPGAPSPPWTLETVSLEKSNV